MEKPKRRIGLLLVNLLSFAALLYLVLSFPPNRMFEIRNWTFDILWLFFVLLFLFIFSLASYLLRSVRRGLLLGLFTTLYLVLRMFHLANILYTILLIAVFVSIELVFVYRK